MTHETFDTYQIFDHPMLGRVCAYTQSGKSLHCSHTHKTDVDKYLGKIRGF